MGCNQSAVPAADSETQTAPGTLQRSKSGLRRNKVSVANGDVPGSQQPPSSRKKSASKEGNRGNVTDRNGNRQDLPSNNAAVPKPVAFAVTLDGTETEDLTLRVPTKLKRLEPLNVPKLTSDMLLEKQKLAEENRVKALESKASLSKKSSRRRRELMRAKEFEMQQQFEQQEKIEDQLTVAERKRVAKMEEIKEKQRIREERAKRARERAKKFKEAEMEVDIDVEKDDAFNASDVDSWLGDDGMDEEAGERIYSGRASPKKKVGRGGDSGVRTVASASTMDSFDTAFQRRRPVTEEETVTYHPGQADDFFDT